MIDALVIGAGSTGLTLGCELIKRGLKVRLIEQLPEATDQSRALGLQSRTLEVFEKMGILDTFLKEGRVVQHINFNLNRKHLLEVDFHLLDAVYPFVLVIPQSVTERILAEHFTALGGTIERGVALQTIHDTQATVLHPNGKEEVIQTKWIFGCDGAHSTVRHSLNLPFTGAAFPESFALADVEIHTSLPDDQIHIFFQSTNLCGLIPLPEKNGFRIITLLSEKNAKQKLDIPFFHQSLDECTGLPLEIEKITWMSTFTIHRRIVPKMRDGNVFLLGDAAHIHSPVGGQGLNTSVHDAFNLAWKIALVHHNLGKECLLDSFDTERHPVAKAVLRYTTLGTNFITTRFLKRLLLPIAALFLRQPFFQKRLLRAISELSFAYPSSPIIGQGSKWQGPKPGERAPDAILSDQSRLFSLFFHPLHTLVCFGEAEFDPLLQMIKNSFLQTIRIVQLSSDESGQAIKAYSATLPCYYLIRPDGVIAYRSRSLDPKPFLDYLSKLFN